MSKHLGDYDASTVVYGKFTTYRPSTGAAYTLGGTPALSVYKDNSTTQSTTGVTLTVDFDSVTGLNHFAIDTSADGTFYAAGSFFDVVITTGTVDSVSVVGAVVASFTIRKDSALKPTTAGRTLDVSSGGEAGVDWANVGSPTTTVNLSGTTVKTATDVETDTADIQSRLPAALVGGRMDANVGAISADSTAADTLELFVEALDQVTGQVDSGTFAAGAIDAAAIANGAIDAATFAADVDAEILSYLVDDATRIDASALNTASAAVGSNGAGLTEAGGTGDHLTAVPWNAAWDAEVQSEVNDGLVAYGAATAANVSAVETDTADIQSRLPAALVSGRIDASVGAMAANTLTASALAADAVTEIQSGLSTVTAAEVQTECEEALQAYHLDHLIASADPGGVVANSSLLAKLVSKSGTPAFTSFDNTTDSLEALRDRGDAAWTTATGFSTLDAAGVRSAVGLASANLDTQLGDLPTASENATGLLDLANGVETGETVRQLLRLLRAVLVGTSADTAGTVQFRRKDGITVALTVAYTSSGRGTSTVGTV